MIKKNMMRFLGNPILVASIMCLLTSCHRYHSLLTVRENQLPASYDTSVDTTSIAAIDWRRYFGDDLLSNLIDTALANNYDLQIALQRLDIVRAGIHFTAGELMPKVDAVAGIGGNRYAKYTQEFAGNSTTPLPNDDSKSIPNPIGDFMVGATASWEIDAWKKLRSQHKAAITNFVAATESKHLLVSNLVAEIAMAYYALIAQDLEIDIINQTIQKQREALAIVESQKEAGKTNELAVQQFKAQLLESQALVHETRQAQRETENTIHFLLGRMPRPIERNKNSFQTELPAMIQSGIPAQLVQYRPDIREAERLVEISGYDVKAAKAAFFPSFQIGLSAGLQSFNPQYLFSIPASIGLSTIGGLINPIINRNAIKAQFQISKANQLTAMYQYQKTILMSYLEVVDGLSNIKVLRELNLLKKEQSNVLAASVDVSNELFKAAKATYLEVLFAQQNALKTQLELIDLSKRQQYALISVYKSLGGGWQP
jgi:outer membrane protein, multidrug efflux system